jgi:hypothetical protein
VLLAPNPASCKRREVCKQQSPRSSPALMLRTTRSSPALDYRNLEMRKDDRRCPGALGPEHPEPRRGDRRRLPLAGSGALSCPIGRDPGTDVRFAGVIGQPALSGASLFGAFKPAVSAASNGLPRLPQVAQRDSL